MSVIILSSSNAPHVFHSFDISSRRIAPITHLFISEFQRHARASEVDQIRLLLEQYSQVIQERSVASQIQNVNDPVQRRAALEDLNAARVGLRILVSSSDVKNNAALTSHVLTIESAIREIDAAIQKMEKHEQENQELLVKGRKEAPSSQHVERQTSFNLLQQQVVNNNRMSAITESNKNALKEIDRKKEQNKKEIHEFYSRQNEKAKLDQAVAQQKPVSEVISVY